MTVPALHRLRETMHAAFGQAGLLGNATNALGGIITKTVEVATSIPVRPALTTRTVNRPGDSGRSSNDWRWVLS